MVAMWYDSVQFESWLIDCLLEYFYYPPLLFKAGKKKEAIAKRCRRPVVEQKLCTTKDLPSNISLLPPSGRHV